LAAFAVRAVYTDVKDSRSYRRLLSTQEFAENGFALMAPVAYGENENIIADARKGPTWLVKESARVSPNWHWLGTDTNGRDVLARMIYGARVSVLVGVLSVGLYTLIGMVLGAVAGYYRGWADMAISRLLEFVICFPVLMVILAVQAFLAPSLWNLIVALALLWWTGVARLQRAEFLRLADAEFVHAVRALGGSDLRIIFLHLMPNSLAPILVVVSFGIAGSIVVESALSFLGFGVPQPMASWGDLLNNGRNDVSGLWWLTIFPGLAIFLTVTCFNLVGEALRDALDPRRAH
jgi:peptide/nickel transport system permease protein